MYTKRWLLIGLASVAFTLCAAVVGAQTRFEEPSNVEDYIRYTTAEQCLAAVSRLSYAISKEATANWDTMPPGGTWRQTPWPASVTESAIRCSDQGTVKNAPLEDFRWLFELYLITARESEAMALLGRRLAEVDSAPDTTRAKILKFVANVYVNARPLRLAQADSIWGILEDFPPSIVPGPEKIGALVMLRDIASEVGDMGRAMQLALRIEKKFGKLTSEEKMSRWTMSGNIIAAENSGFIHFDQRMDSLRRSTSAYIKLKEAQERDLSTLAGIMVRDAGVGRVTPPLRATFWFPEAPRVSRPTAGKISLIWPLNQDCGQGESFEGNMGRRCAGMLSMLRRVQQRYPGLEITLLTHTVGYFLAQAPPSPAREAEFLRRWLLDDQHLSATLAVGQMPFVTLSDPDRRTVNTYTELEGMSEFLERPYSGDNLVTYSVVDESGIVVWETYRTSWDEARLYTVLDILLRRTN